MPKATAPAQAPLSTELIVQAPTPITVQAPDVTELVTRYNAVILPLWRKYQSTTIATADDYVQWNADWQTFTKFSSEIEALFEAPCKEAYDAHRTLTGMRGYIKSFPDQGAAYIGAELMRFKKDQERLRVLEEQRLQAAEAERQELERRRLQAIADAERAQAEAARQAALKNIDPWEVDEETLPVVPEPVIVELPPPAPVRLPSSVPNIAGGPRMVDKPWECVIDDPVAVLKWVLEEPDTRISRFVFFNMARPSGFHGKASELGEDISKTIPGTRAVRGTTLKRS